MYITTLGFIVISWMIRNVLLCARFGWVSSAAQGPVTLAMFPGFCEGTVASSRLLGCARTHTHTHTHKRTHARTHAYTHTRARAHAHAHAWQIMKKAAQRPQSASQKQMDDMDNNLFPTAKKSGPKAGRRASASKSPTAERGGGRRSSGAGGGVYDRLTDQGQYTGMYANRNEEAIMKDDPNVQKKGTGHAKNFGDAPVQKFGLQVVCPAGRRVFQQPSTVR